MRLSLLRWQLLSGVFLAVLITGACDDPAPPKIDTTPTAPAVRSPTRVPDTPVPQPTPDPTATLVPPTRIPGSPTPKATAEPPTPIASPTVSAVPATVTPPPTPDAQQRGGTLNISFPENIAHQDVQLEVSPALSSWGPGVAYSRLLRLKSGPAVELPSLELECDLCERWTMDSPTSFVFKLRKDVRWQSLDPVNGRPVVASDLVFSYGRQRNPEHPNSSLLSNLAEVRASDDTTLRVSLGAADADGLLALADAHSKIVAREAVELKGDLRDGPTIGTGPWTLERTSIDDVHAFLANADYFENRLPLADRLNIYILGDEQTRAAAFGTGLIDVDEVESSDRLNSLESVDPALQTAILRPGIGLEIAFNTKRPPFDVLEVRQAAIRAMDPVKAIEEHWNGLGSIGPGFPAASPEWLLPWTEMLVRFNQRDDVRPLLEGRRLEPVVITVGDFGEQFLAHAHAMNVELDAAGFYARVDIVNRRRFGEDVWLGGDYQVMLGPPAPVNVPNGFLLPVLHSDGIWNTTGHQDPRLDTLLETQAVELEPARRAELIRNVQRRVLDMGYRFMPYTRLARWTWSADVRDFHPNFQLGEYHHWARVWLDR